MQTLSLLQSGPVIPVIVLNDPGLAVDLGRSLLDGGIRILEGTLRTKGAPAAIARLRAELPKAIVGTGTVPFTRPVGGCA